MKTKKKIHFIGIGGIGTSALANIMHAQGHQISGSDLQANGQTKHLQEKKIKIYSSHNANNIITEQPDEVIYSLAINKKNPEYQEAIKQNCKLISYPEKLGEVTQSYKLIAIAGTHGKTTSTGLLAHTLIKLGLDPTVILGSTSDSLNQTNYHLGKSNLFILEACEYHQGFLNLKPFISLITNIEHDHFDAYKTEEDYLNAFQKLIANSHFSIINQDFKLAKKIKHNDNIKFFHKNEQKFTLKLLGEHNQTNATGVSYVLDHLKINNYKQHFKTFNGTGRRLEIIKKTNNQIIYDDYGHHPTEITAVAKALRAKYKTAKICLIYQPHQHNRSIKLVEEFKLSFKNFTKVYISNIYAARDTLEEKNTMSPQKFATQTEIEFIELSKLQQQFTQITKPYKIVVIMGAGDISTQLKSYL